MSRLSIEISREQHKKIKALAALKGKTIKELILDRLLSPGQNEEDEAWNELQELLRRRIKNVESNISSKSVEQITNEVLKEKES